MMKTGGLFRLFGFYRRRTNKSDIHARKGRFGSKLNYHFGRVTP
jgi:hypothetical protein